jgi:hypothetical protein
MFGVVVVVPNQQDGDGPPRASGFGDGPKSKTVSSIDRLLETALIGCLIIGQKQHQDGTQVFSTHSIYSPKMMMMMNLKIAQLLLLFIVLQVLVMDVAVHAKEQEPAASSLLRGGGGFGSNINNNNMMMMTADQEEMMTTGPGDDQQQQHRKLIIGDALRAAGNLFDAFINAILDFFRSIFN